MREICCNKLFSRLSLHVSESYSLSCSENNSKNCLQLSESFVNIIKSKRNVQSDEEVGTNDKRCFIQLNGPSSGYKGTQRFLKAVLLSMYGSAYPSHFGNPATSEMMKRFITLKVVCKINDNAFCLSYFK